MPSERDAVETYIRLSGDAATSLVELTIIGLMVVDKWDKADKAVGGIALPKHTLHHATFSDLEAKEFRKNSHQIIRDYTASIGASKINKDWKDWLSDVGVRLISSFVWAVLLLSFALILQVFGSDLQTVFKWAVERH